MSAPLPLLEEIANGRCVPFIGAGFSINARVTRGKKIPTWKQLTMTLASAVGTESTDPLFVTAIYEEKFGRAKLIEKIRDLLNADELQPAEVHKKFAKIPFDIVYTTNYDFLLEKAYEESNRTENPDTNKRPCRVIVGDEQLVTIGPVPTTNIIKMHGDFSHISSFVVTKKDYEQYLDEHAMIATHLSSMLITRTALFIGYSLNDADLNHIRNIINSRLGRLAIKSYIITFNASANQVTKFKNQNLNIINLGSNKKRQIIKLLDEIIEHITVNTVQTAVNRTREDISKKKIESAVERKRTPTILEGVSYVCLTVMKIQISEYIYHDVLKPIIEKYGLEAMRSNEIKMNDPVWNEIRVRILQSKLIICDLTSKPDFVMYELGIAIENQKNIIILAQSLRDIPPNLRDFEYIIYNSSQDGLKILYTKLDNAVRKVLITDAPYRARSLIEIKNYEHAIVLMISYLETLLNNFLKQTEDVRIGLNIFRFAINKLRKLGILNEIQERDLLKWKVIRNKIVHEMYMPNKQEAQNIVDGIDKLVFLKDNLNELIDWTKYLNDNDRKLLTDRFLIELGKLSAEFVPESGVPIYISGRLIFDHMNLHAFSDKLLPVIILINKVQGYIKTADVDQKVSITAKGRNYVKSIGVDIYTH